MKNVFSYQNFLKESSSEEEPLLVSEFYVTMAKESEIGMANGTQLMGKLQGIKYEELIGLFGEPTIIGGDKTQVEWIGVIHQDVNDSVFTIYDWKEDVGPEHVTTWHVGGSSKKAADELIELVYFTLFPWTKD